MSAQEQQQSPAAPAERQGTAANLLSGGCPVLHKKNNEETTTQQQQQQQQQTKTGGMSTQEQQHQQGATAANLLSGGCPVRHSKKEEATQQQQQQRTEPPDTPDHPIDLNHAEVKVEVKQSDHPYDQIPDSVIPAAGRGNSEDGQTWLNPSANQLFRALKRKEKPIEYEDAMSVAQVHEIVTDYSWKAVMEFERLHQDECPSVTLSRFDGKDGIYSPKARILKTFFGTRPFDRHDWTVDRCGKEIRYIIDYYAFENQHGEVEYTVDARPTGVGGMIDRFRVAFSKWRKGEPWN